MSAHSTANLQVVPAQATQVVAFGLKGSVQRLWADAFAKAGTDLEFFAPKTVGDARRGLEVRRCLFAVVALPVRGERLWPGLGILSLRRIPVVTITDGPIDAAAMERARKMNAACLLDASVVPDAALIDRLSGAGGWFSSRLRRAPLPDLLQMMANTEPALVEVSCQHAGTVVTSEQISRSCRGGSSACSGFSARIYLKKGAIQHVEGTGCSGMAALGHTLELSRGELRVHEMYIEPARPNVELPVHRALLDAAIHVDDRARAEGKDPAPSSARTGQPTWPSPKNGIRLGARPSTQMPIVTPADLAAAENAAARITTAQITGSGTAARRIMLPPLRTPDMESGLGFDVESAEDAGIIDLSAEIHSVDTPIPAGNPASPTLDGALRAVGGARAMQIGVSGVVLAERGFVEPELMASVLALAAETLEEVGTALGWGPCTGWAISTDKSATIAACDAGNRWLAVEGGPSKFLGARLGALSTVARGER